MPPRDEDQATVDLAYAHLRGHTRAELRFDEHLQKIKYVIDPSGRLVAPAMVAMLSATDTVLFVPDCTEDAMELMVSVEPLEETGPGGEAADRWRIYHGEPPDVRWMWMDLDAARFDGCVIDGEVLTRENPIANAIATVCRELNARPPEDLQRLCRHFAGTDVETPRVVGVDPLGVDLRRRFDVVRLPAPEPMQNADDALRVVTRMLEEAGT